MNSDESNAGIFVTEDATFALSNFSIAIDETGGLRVSPVSVGLAFDACPVWLEIAYSHLLAARNQSEALSKAVQAGEAKLIAFSLEQEFRAGVQTIVSTCIALDAFYASVKPHSGVPKQTAEAWKRNGKARYVQISLTLCKAFSIKNAEASAARNLLGELYGLRDFAVHPSSAPLPAALHPEIGLVVDQRFARFRYYNAKVGLRNAVRLLAALLSQPGKRETLVSLTEKLNKRLTKLIAQWDRDFGPLKEEG